MLVLFDVGNTAVTYGLYGGGRLHSFGHASNNDIPLIDKKWADSGRYDHDNAVVISSVVPRNTSFLRNLYKRRKGFTVLEVGRDLPIEIKSQYKNCKRLGVDRAVNIYGATRIYNPPLIIIDFGTAITVDYVSSHHTFQGGMIIPGPEIAFHSLIEKAALLPKKLRLPNKSLSFLGRTTYDCMCSGILEGYGSMVDELVKRFKKRFSPNLRIISTGGFARNLKPFSRSLGTIDLQLSVKSLILLAKARRT